MLKRLSELKPGESAVIQSIDEDTLLKKRLLELGIRKGKDVSMRRDAPLGDPIEISVMGYNISLRKSEAKHVIIDFLEDKQAG